MTRRPRLTPEQRREEALEQLAGATVTLVGKYCPHDADLREFVEEAVERSAARLIGAMGLDLDATLQGIRERWYKDKSEEST